jgi:hypothetical protein
MTVAATNSRFRERGLVPFLAGVELVLLASDTECDEAIGIMLP